MVAVKGRKNSSKNPPIFSHEFVIQNHADIVSCVAMVFVVGLMVQVTSSWAYTFIAMHHNVTNPIEDPTTVLKYTTGWKDACAVFFYFLITIIMHAVLQEYIFDKISKRLHLSKAKLFKFNESSQLIVFYIVFSFWAIDIIIRENILLNLPALWKEYPMPMTFSLKLFFICQLAYWLHCYPELYFQRVKKEDIPLRVLYATIALFFTSLIYFFNFQQLGVILLTLHFMGDALLHGARLTHFISQKEKPSRLSFLIANSTYVFARVATIVLSAVVFIYGLRQQENKFDYATGNFNIPAVQYTAISVISFSQGYLLYLLIAKQLKRARENAVPVVVKTKPKQKSRKREGKKSAQSEDDELPEVDQATKKNLRNRPSAKAK
ncbi:translocating chain-associated membrane protein 1 [Harpegnathos saltator]|uniref:Translocation-associated membrane protein 1-like 1 n=1 Tax=Harpegnathos saltator TaxID=610380 RepID=E2BGC4_HARSA|nr:translocating chain-associated membrane protein 1 [Harpegnathos saltator]EFN85260.1 Translocation-associated membrane protein 1-like 1 [Harpegnathos saltator]